MAIMENIEITQRLNIDLIILKTNDLNDINVSEKVRKNCYVSTEFLRCSS